MRHNKARTLIDDSGLRITAPRIAVVVENTHRLPHFIFNDGSLPKCPSQVMTAPLPFALRWAASLKNASLLFRGLSPQCSPENCEMSE